MAFCKNCGAQLEGNEKFCVKCGTPVVANEAAAQPPGPGSAVPVAPVQAAVAPMMAATAVPARPAVVMQPQPAAGSYVSFAAPPVAVPLPQAAPMKHSWATTVIVLVVLAAGGYYYQKYQATPAAPQPGTPPAQPAQAPQPAQPPAPGQPGAAPTVPGGGQGAAQQQAFAGHWQVDNGFVVISNGTWKNNSNTAMQSAVLECDQFNAGRTDLAQMKMTLNGPVQPGGTVTFNAFQMGGAVMNMQTVNCAIVDVTPAS